jgi:hygromycin-B 7''-O-kinase
VTDAAERLINLRGVAPTATDDAVLVESWSNDTWVTTDAVLRVCWRGDRARLLRERVLLDALPTGLPHATVLGAGSSGDETWIVLQRVPGERLDLVWPTLSRDEQRLAVAQLGHLLRVLHRWSPPREVRTTLLSAAAGAPATPPENVGSAIVPWPQNRIAPLLEWSGELLQGESGLEPSLRRRIEMLGPFVPEEEFEEGRVIHGDAHFANVLWNQGELAALLDFEWARIGPPDLELEALCREDPQIEMEMLNRGALATEVSVLCWLREGYPELFERKDLTERVWLYQICYEIRALGVHAGEQLGDRRIARLRSLAAHPWVRFH